MKKHLPTVTLLGIDCVDIDRLIQAAEICMKDFNFAEVKLLTSLPTEGIENIVPIKPIKTIEEYSEFAISELNKYVDTTHVLIIQYDGFILNPSAWSDEYLDYDYIGAPLKILDWSIKAFNLNPNTNGDLVVGNGGFCLRSKKLLHLLSEMSTQEKIPEYHPEDVVICIKIKQKLEAQGIKFAPVELAEQFSFEHSTKKSGEWTSKWTDEFGFHGLKWSDISDWINKHPEYNIDNSLNRDRYTKKPPEDLTKSNK